MIFDKESGCRGIINHASVINGVTDGYLAADEAGITADGDASHLQLPYM